MLFLDSGTIEVCEIKNNIKYKGKAAYVDVFANIGKNGAFARHENSQNILRNNEITLHTEYTLRNGVKKRTHNANTFNTD